ncbi:MULTISPECIES: hypothetical protein [Clostridia]|uniref:hypothetical protein n=1 Tax=Clostridia TaxID=186801 RepID=UPI000EA3EDF1|nr:MULTISPECIES: hypothetical protein [Clostridia]NBJ70445.1 hypothetical protein [Roseburia sp. 1XD42-34]RKI76280.1 hypothetical protein D7V87_13925 [Clostridium sp. 1xD42-85]
MQFETRSLIFDNLLVYETRQLRKNWQQGLFIMEDFILAEGIYQNGPIFFSVSPEKNEDKFGKFTYYLPISEPVRLSDETDFFFQEQLYIKEALVLRQADQATDFHAAYKRVQEYAHQHDVPLEDTFYCVLLEVYDEVIIDLYIPLNNRGESS